MTHSRDGDENPIDGAAAEWAAAVARGLTPEEEKSLAAWLAADDRHHGALVRSQAIWLAIGDRSPAGIARRPERRPTVVTRRRWLAGAGVGLAAGVGALAWVRIADAHRFGTRRGEVRQSPLDDGSSVSLNTETRVVAQYSEQRRSIRLDQGEAWFDVAKDPGRPFVVNVGDVSVTAVGTAFTVRRFVDHVEVVVTEGVVEARLGAVFQRVKQAQAAAIHQAGGITVREVDAGRMHRALAWRSGLIVLDGERMDDAVATFNRYSDRPVRLAPRLAADRMVGVFRTQDAEGFARAAGKLLNAPVVIGPDDIQIGVS